MSEQSPDRSRPVVLVLLGGASSEHGVSCLTAASVVEVVDREVYDVVGVGITGQGRWVRLEVEEVLAMSTVDGELPQVPEDRPGALLVPGADGVDLVSVAGDQLTDRVRVDVALALLHGPFGEDGTLQGMFEMLGLRYVGAGVCASAVAMDKERAKQVLAAAGLPVGAWTSFTAEDWRGDPARCLDAVASLPRPVFVKPARGGSSVGISRVGAGDDVAAAVEEALHHDTKVVVEQGVVGAREVECAVLAGPDGPELSEPGEIRTATASGFYDFAAKYLPETGQVELVAPAELEASVRDRVQVVARQAWHALGVDGLARVDTFVTDDGQVLLNEVNTMPGFTRYSFYPVMWQASGLAYPELVARLLSTALDSPLPRG